MSGEKKQTFDKQLENGNKYFYCLYIQLESAQRPLTCCFWQHFAAVSAATLAFCWPCLTLRHESLL